eukprot:602465-Hanusia_phi.AAC.1
MQETSSLQDKLDLRSHLEKSCDAIHEMFGNRVSAAEKKYSEDISMIMRELDKKIANSPKEEQVEEKKGGAKIFCLLLLKSGAEETQEEILLSSFVSLRTKVLL